jgi:S-adenosylmethionine:tRNA ribosyltransferase-isomerase
MPLSTLLMMASAFSGYNFLFEAYKVAIAEKYRFGTYGDAMFIM